VGFDASLAATHPCRRLGRVETFEGSQQKSLALAGRQSRNGCFERVEGRVLSHHVGGRRIGGCRAIDQIDRIVVLFATPTTPPRDDPMTSPAATPTIMNAVREDAVEQRTPLSGRPRAITVSQLQHRILHRIERVGRVPQLDFSRAQGPPLHLPQETIKFGSAVQTHLQKRLRSVSTAPTGHAV